MSETTSLPPCYRYTIYASCTDAGVATLWDANARRRDGSYVAGTSGDTPEGALAALVKVLPHEG